MINFKTKIAYTNTNAQKLADSGFANPNWMTFNQAREMGYKINKGESGTQLLRVVEKKVKNKETGKLEKKKVAKAFYVFNLEQMTKITETEVAA